MFCIITHVLVKIIENLPNVRQLNDAKATKTENHISNFRLKEDIFSVLKIIREAIEFARRIRKS